MTDFLQLVRTLSQESLEGMQGKSCKSPYIRALVRALLVFVTPAIGTRSRELREVQPPLVNIS